MFQSEFDCILQDGSNVHYTILAKSPEEAKRFLYGCNPVEKN
jgi:hypothetical protein